MRLKSQALQQEEDRLPAERRGLSWLLSLIGSVWRRFVAEKRFEPDFQKIMMWLPKARGKPLEGLVWC